jgi:hypothetical protein
VDGQLKPGEPIVLRSTRRCSRTVLGRPIHLHARNVETPAASAKDEEEREVEGRAKEVGASQDPADQPDGPFSPKQQRRHR